MRDVLSGVRLKIMSGDIKTIELALIDDDGAALDLTGYGDIDFQVFALVDGVPSGAAVISENILGDVSIADADDGYVDIDLVASDTSGLDGTYYWELQAEDGSGNEHTVLGGPFVVTGDLFTS